MHGCCSIASTLLILLTLSNCGETWHRKRHPHCTPHLQPCCASSAHNNTAASTMLDAGPPPSRCLPLAFVLAVLPSPASCVLCRVASADVPLHECSSRTPDNPTGRRWRGKDTILGTVLCKVCCEASAGVHGA